MNASVYLNLGCVIFKQIVIWWFFCAKRANDYQPGVRGISQFLLQKKGSNYWHMPLPILVFLMNQERICL